jgi:glycolate oxidase FAD binding subunit
MTAERAVAPAVRDALAAACPALSDGGPADAVCGVAPSFVGSPASPVGAAAVGRAGAGAGLSVVPRGAGSGLAWGLPPASCDLVVDMRRMDTVVEHAAGDLVARVQAGALMGQVAAVLAEAGQQLALDAPADATVGGVIATGTAGPRRFRYGTPRDLLIGITVVRADGVVAHSGGKVVKNVAGYDLGKLLAGSQGTLGLVTEATFRLHPLPAAAAWVTAEFAAPDRAAAAVAAASGSALVPSAVELDWPAGGPLRAGVLVEGTPSGVEERARQVSGLLESAGGSAVAACGSPPARWGRLPSSGTVVRVSFWVSRLAGVLAAVSACADEAGVRPAVTGSAGAGVLYACVDPAAGSDAVARFTAALRGRLAGSPPRGSVTVLAGAALAAGAVDPLGPVPGLALMHAVKDQFDPGGRMFPGRLFGRGQ